MKDYLSATQYCDIHHPLVKAKAELLSRSSAKDTAIAIWDFISLIDYRFDFWNVKASETLEKKQGMCTNKANLQIALLRANGIPAGYGVMKIDREAFRKISTTDFFEKISPVTTHVFCYVFLDGRWIAADATRDRKIPPEKAGIEDIRLHPWDGETDFKKPAFVVSEEPMVANLDAKLEIKPRFLTREVLDEINSHIDRSEGRAR